MTEFQNEIWKFANNNIIGISSRRNVINSRYTERRTMTWEKSFRDLDNRETQPVLDKIKLIEDQWRTMDLWRIVKLVNPSPVMEFDQEDLPQRNETEHKADEVLRRSIILCCMFEDLSKKFGWKVGDTLDIEEDICDVVGKLILKVDEHDEIKYVGLHAECNNETSSQWKRTRW